MLDACKETTRTLFKGFELDDKGGLIGALSGDEVVANDTFTTLIAGFVASIWSTSFTISRVRSWLVPGLADIITNKVPVSSLGTRPVFVVAIVMPNTTNPIATAVATNHFLPIILVTMFLLFVGSFVENTVEIAVEPAHKGIVMRIFLLVMWLQ